MYHSFHFSFVIALNSIRHLRSIIAVRKGRLSVAVWEQTHLQQWLKEVNLLFSFLFRDVFVHMWEKEAILQVCFKENHVFYFVCASFSLFVDMLQWMRHSSTLQTHLWLMNVCLFSNLPCSSQKTDSLKEHFQF